MLYSDPGFCCVTCCYTGFLVGWLTYGFTIYFGEKMDETCGFEPEFGEGKELHGIFFIILCLTVPAAFCCMFCLLICMCSGCLACCSPPPEEKE